jgi:2-methylcitrate dehydratase PrpD
MQSGNDTEALAAFAASLRFDDLPAGVIAAVKAMILDSLGTALAATTLGDGCAESVAVMQRLGGPKEATILGTKTKVAATGAAFANGALVHALNYDPIGATIGHVGVICLAAPLAMAEAAGDKSGRDLIVASAAACEITARITEAIARTGRRPSEKFLSGQLLTYFGAAVGAGRILGLNGAGMHSALGLALMQMAGSRQITQDGDPPAKAIYGAFPNQAGVQAALLAEAGLGADIDIFGKPAGLYPVIYDGDGLMDALTENLGSDYFLTKVGFKPWPTSDQLHPSIEAAADIARTGIVPADIKTVEITLPKSVKPWCEPLAERRHPANPAAAANSIPFCTAKALVNGDVTLSDFTEKGLGDEAVLNISDLITHHLSDEAAGATVNVTMVDGSEHTAQIDQPLGSSARPISAERLKDKFRDCCSHAESNLTHTQIETLGEMVDNLEGLDDVGKLTALASGQ